jgi:hypothetical protein
MSSGIPTANGREYRRTKIECEDAQRVGSRFIGWQVYWTAASAPENYPARCTSTWRIERIDFTKMREGKE